MILRTRPARSAAKYASIWTPQGSPLLHWTQRQADGLQAELQARGHDVLVRPAMRYGEPAVDRVLDALQAEVMSHRCRFDERVLHSQPLPLDSMLSCRWRMNRFLFKWISYLRRQGYTFQ